MSERDFPNAAAALREFAEMTESLSDEELRKLDAELAAATGHLLWVPNPGFQQMALETLADELFYGGEPGGGKSKLLCGVAVVYHHKSILFRREFPQVKGLIDLTASIIGSTQGLNQSTHTWTLPGGREIEYGSVPHEWDVQRYQGRPHDLIGFDEISAFSRSQYLYLCLWNRPSKPGQRCRIICTGNPPSSPEGLWVLEHWAAWIDPGHHDPAQPGELRWPVRASEDSDAEIFFRSKEEALEHLAKSANPLRDHNGEIIPPRSRTYVPSKLEETPELLTAGYQQVLANAPRNLQSLAKGHFEATLEDDLWQVFRSADVDRAMKRWSPYPPQGIPMSALGVDPALGGNDSTAISARFDHWFAPLISTPGKQTPNPSDVVGLIQRHRRNGAVICVDCDGGWGSGIVERLRENGAGTDQVKVFKGSSESNKRRNRIDGFANKRAEAHFKLADALADPNSKLALPSDPALKADLCAARYKRDTSGRLQIESKDEIRKRIGRSPDRSDALILAYYGGMDVIGRHPSPPGGGGGGFSFKKRPSSYIDKNGNNMSPWQRHQAKIRNRGNPNER